MILGEGQNGIPVLTVQKPGELEALKEAVVADYHDDEFMVGHLLVSSIIENDKNLSTVLPFELRAQDAVRALCALGRHQSLLDTVEIIDVAA